MDSETKRILIQFDDEQVVHTVCLDLFKRNMSYEIPKAVISAWKQGLLEHRDFGGDLVDDKKLYSRMLILTATGRAAVGLPPLIPVAAVEKKSKAPKPVTKSLFD